MAGNPLKQPGDGIYRAILVVLALSVGVGVLLAISAESLFQSKPLGDVGAGLALTSGLLYLFLRLLGRREEKRRRQEAERAGDENHEDP